MARIDRSKFEGFLIPDPRCTADTIDADESSYTQQGLYPGIPVPGSATSCALQASGEMVSSDDVRVICQIAGMPDRGCEIVHRLESAASTTAAGWEQPNVITGIELPAAYDTDQYQSDPCLVTLSDGTALLFHDLIDVSPVARRVDCRRIEADGTIGTRATVAEGLSTYKGHACACVLEDDRVLCFWGRLVTPVGSYFDTYEINASMSSDGGATWDTIAYGVLPTAYRIGTTGGYSIDPTSMRMSAAYKDGQVLLLVTVNSDANDVSMRLYQYASTDGGASFSLVDNSDGTTVRGGDRHDIVVKDGAFIVAMIRQVEGANLASEHLYPQSVRLTSAFDPIFSQAFTTITSTEVGTWTADAGTDYYVSDGDLSLVALNGVLYCHVRKVASPYQHLVYYSSDNGDTWTFLSPTGDAEPFWFQSGEVGQHWAGWRATAQRGRMLMATGVDGDTEPEKHLWLLSLGGWSTQTLPQNRQDAAPRTRSWSHWAWTWMPTGLPANWSGAVTATGTAASNTVASGYHLISTTTGNNYFLEVPLTGGGSDANVGQMIEFEVDIPGPNPTLGTTSTGGTVQMGVRLYTQDLGVSVALGYDYIHVYDDNAGTKIGHFAYPGSRLVMRIYVGDGTVRTYYRTVSSSGGMVPLRSWTAGPTGALSTGSPSPTDVVQWGHIDASAANCSSRWYRLQFANEDKHAFPHDLAEDGQANPTDLSGAYLTSTGTELRDGLRVSATTGPYYVGEYHTIAREWEYGLTQALVDVEPSRTSGWRSVDDDSDQVITFDRRVASSDTLVADAWGVCMWGINFRSFKVYRYIGGVPALLQTVDVTAEFANLEYEISGNVVRPSSSATGISTRWISRNELVGGYFVDDGGELRHIIANDPGIWGDRSEHVTPRLYLDASEMDGTETASGTGFICPPRAFWFYLENQEGGKEIEELQIKIEAQVTPEGYFKCDLMMIGAVKPPGQHPSWGGAQTKTPNVVLTSYEDGRRSAAIKGDSQRVIRIGWTEGIPNQHLIGASPAPDWYGSHTEAGLGMPMVARDDTPGNLWGLIDEIGGASQVVAWVRQIDAETASVGTFAVTYTDADRVIPVRWTGGVELGTVQERGGSAVQTVAVVTLEEEL